MMTQPLMTLAARFDVNQVDDGIDWIFTDINSVEEVDSPSCDPHWNRNIEFSAGQDFRIAIVANDHEKTGLESMEVVDCCIITRPRIISCGPGVQTRYGPPSLFVNNNDTPLGALYQIDPSAFSVHGSGIDPAAGRKITLLWDGHLTVGPYNGFWELSFYVTISIKRAGQDSAQLRVFYFDPETEIGNGTKPPN